MNFAAGMAVAAACVGAAGVARAQLVDISQPNVTLAQVLGHQFQVGDKLFTVPDNGFASVAFDPTQIFISALTTENPAFGSGFRLSSNFSDTGGNAFSSDLVFSYTVEILPSAVALGMRFSSADLGFDGTAAGAGSFARVDETVLDINNNILSDFSVYFNGVGPSALTASTDAVDGLTTLSMIKDVQFFANGAGTAGATFVDQTFDEVLSPVPGTAVIAAVGLMVLGAHRIRSAGTDRAS